MPALRALCLTAALAAFARLAGAVGPVVRCETCDAGALTRCEPLPEDCVERVREPGCGCCATCALSEGQACGVYSGRCGSGLTCRHRPGEGRPLRALLEGRGVCSGARKKQENAGGPAAGRMGADAHNATEAEADGGGGGGGRPQGAAGAGRGALSPKLEVIRKEQSRRSQSYKVELVSGGLNTDVHNLSLESKREAEYGPCRREMEGILNSLKISNVLNPRGFRIPNCDKKGFYKKKQCRPSKGRRRGFCWCVDKYGQSLPVYDGKEKGDALCYNLESQ